MICSFDVSWVYHILTQSVVREMILAWNMGDWDYIIYSFCFVIFWVFLYLLNVLLCAALLNYMVSIQSLPFELSAVNWLYWSWDCSYWFNCSQKSIYCIFLAYFSYWAEIFQSLWFSCESSGLSAKKLKTFNNKLEVHLHFPLTYFPFLSVARKLHPSTLVFYMVIWNIYVVTYMFDLIHSY